MAVIKTQIRVVPTDTEYLIPGDYSAAQIVTMYTGTIDNIASYASSEQVQTGPDGDVRVVTFTARSGNKG
jgi:hypothetical protein